MFYNIIFHFVITVCFTFHQVTSFADLDDPAFQWPLCHMTNAFDTINREDGLHPTVSECPPLALGPPLIPPPFYAFWFEDGTTTYAHMPTVDDSSTFESFSISLYVYPDILDGMILSYKAATRSANRFVSFYIHIQYERLAVVFLDSTNTLVLNGKSQNQLVLHQWNLLVIVRDAVNQQLHVRVNDYSHPKTTTAAPANSDDDGVDNDGSDDDGSDDDGSDDDEGTSDTSDGDGDGDDGSSCSDCGDSGSGSDSDSESNVDDSRYLLLTEGSILISQSHLPALTSFKGRVCCLAIYDDVIDIAAPTMEILQPFVNTADLAGDLTGVGADCTTTTEAATTTTDGEEYTTNPSDFTTSYTTSVITAMMTTADNSPSTIAETTTMDVLDVTSSAISDATARTDSTATATTVEASTPQTMSTTYSEYSATGSTSSTDSGETTTFLETTTGVVYNFPIKELWPLSPDTDMYGVVTNSSPRYPSYFKCFRNKNVCSETGLQSVYFDGSRLSMVDFAVVDTFFDGDFTLSMFVRADEPGEGTVLEFASSPSKTGGILGYRVFFEAGLLTLSIMDRTGICGHVVSSALVKNAWSHVYIYRKASLKTSSLYVDGTPSAITDTCRPNLYDAANMGSSVVTGTLRLGRSYDQSHGVVGFHGSLSCLTVFDDLVGRSKVKDATIERCQTLKASFPPPAQCSDQHFAITSLRFVLLASDKRPGHEGLPGPVAAQNATSLLDCSQRCSAFPYCRSYTYYQDQAGHSQQTQCYMYDFVTNYLLSDAQGYNYYEIIPDV